MAGVASAPAVAGAEVGTYAQGAVAPAPVSTPDPSQRAIPQTGLFACKAPWAVVQAQPSGYVIGNCRRGTALRRTAKSAQYNKTYWDGGYVAGNHGGCGWIQVEFDVYSAKGSTGACGFGSVGYRLDQYAVNNNNAPGNTGCSNHGSGCTDGTNVRLAVGCGLYANYRPWLPRQGGRDLIRNIPAGTVVKWRYVAKYPNADGSGYMVMVRQPSVKSGQGNWGFIHRKCFGVLPYQVKAR